MRRLPTSDDSGEMPLERSDPAVSSTHASRRGGAFGTAIAGVVVLIIHSALVAVGIGEVATVVVNGALASALFLRARRSGSTPSELGVVVRRRGLMAAAIASAVAVACVLAIACLGLVPVDLALSGLTAADVWFRVLVAIPIGTALCEELIFRGVLLSAWDSVLGRRWSTVVVSILFGLWHVAAEAQRTGAFGLGVVPGVLATAAASAFVLCPLRRRTGDLAAPVAVHAATNVSVFVAVLVASGGAG